MSARSCARAGRFVVDHDRRCARSAHPRRSPSQRESRLSRAVTTACDRRMTDNAYEGALARFAELATIANEPIAPACKAFCFRHGRRAASTTLFLHGLTASPRRFAALAVHAYRSGDNVIVPRLPHHGHLDRMSRGLQHLRADELLASLEAHLELAGRLGQTVRVVGFSLRGLLAAWVTQHHCVRRDRPVARYHRTRGQPGRCRAQLSRSIGTDR